MADTLWFARNQRIATLFLLASLLTACGGGGDDGGSSGSTDNGTGVVVLGSGNTGGAAAADVGGGTPTVQGVSVSTSTAPMTLTGSVVDGPVVGASITIRDANGRWITTTTSDATARYSVTIPARTPFPLTIVATGGTNLVTQTAPTFSLISTALSTTDTTANINPFSTLITRTALKMDGGITPANLEAANHNILTVFNAGIDRARMPSPITTPVTNENVTMLVKSSEVLAEIIRRNFSVVSGVNTQVTQDSLIESLAADMTDGTLDGKGAVGTDALISASTSVVSGQVLIEALSNNLQVNDVPVTHQLESAVSTIMPAAGETTGELQINTEMLLNTQTAIAAAMLIAPSIALSDIQTTVNSIASGTSTSEVSTLLLADAGGSFDPAITTVVSSTSSQTTTLASVSTPVNESLQAPYGGSPWTIPGLIEAENYDAGGAGVAYSDTTPGNAGGYYRNDNVDIWVSTDVGGGYMVGTTNTSEWLEYTVNVLSAGTYTMNLRVATPNDGMQVRMLSNGNDLTGALVAPNTGGWQNWQTLSKTVNLPSGQQVLRLKIDNGSININSIEFLADISTTAQRPFGDAPWPVPGKIEAENYDLGGAGIAYNDSTTGNAGGYHRDDNVDIWISADIGGGYMIGATNAGEWLEYTVNVATTGTYTINLRAATAETGKQVRVLMGGVDVTGAMAVPNTGGWQNWQTVTKTVNLSAGQRVMRLQIDNGSVNINSIEILAGGTTTSPDTVANTKLTVSWKPNPESVNGYIVYFGPSASAVTNETTDVKAFAGSFDPAKPAIEYDSWYDLGLRLGDSVCFKLRAYNADGLSDWSLPACTTVPLTL